MYGLPQEDPSQILRRIRVAEAEDDELPTLPSPPGSDVNDSSYQTSMVVRRPSKAISNYHVQHISERRVLSPLRVNSSSMNANMEGEQAKNPIGAKNNKPVQVHSGGKAPSPAIKTPSTASSGRTVVYMPNAIPRQLGKSARVTEISFGETSFDQPGAANLDSPRASPKEGQSQEEDNSASKTGLNFDSQDLERLDEFDSEVLSTNIIQSAVEYNEETGNSATPEHQLESRVDRAAFPQTIQEEDEETDASRFAPPSPTSSSVSANEGLSATEQRITHVVVRRRTNPILKRSAALRGSPTLTPDSPSFLKATSPATTVPGRSSNDSDFSTPGMGRRHPSAERQSEQNISIRSTPAGILPKSLPNELSASDSPSSKNSSRAYPDNFATPRMASKDADLERRKSHLLSTLRLTALRSASKSKLKRGTPFPSRRARSFTPEINQDSSSHAATTRDTSNNDINEMDVTSSSSVSTSSDDLTTNPRGKGNVSLPLTRTGVEAAHADRFNSAKLNNYLHALNTHLTKENQNLVDTLTETQNEMQRLVKRTADMSTASSSEDGDRTSGRKENEGDNTKEMLQGHQRTREDIVRLRRHLTGDEADSEMPSKEVAIGKQISILQKQLESRNVEIVSLRDQVLHKTSENGATPAKDADLQRQVFALIDDLATAHSESAAQSMELGRLRHEIVTSTLRNTAAISDSQGRADELLLQLEDRDEELEIARNALKEQDAGFAEKMKNLEDELCKVMEEQEEQLRASCRELEDTKVARNSQEKLLNTELERRMLEAEKNHQALRMEKEKMEAMLAEITAKASLPTAEKHDIMIQERINNLQGEVTRLQELSESKADYIQQISKEAEIHSSKQADNIRGLEDKIGVAERCASHMEGKLSTQAVTLEETNQSLKEAEANLHIAHKEISRLEIQLEEARSSLMRKQQEQANISIAFDNELQKKLDAAQREVGNLRHQLASPSVNRANADAKELEIRTLKSSNHELETRVGQLKRQAMTNAMLTPSKSTPEKSVRFDSVKSMRTPRSASQLLGNMSLCDRTPTEANLTVVPLYAEIDNLQDQIKALRGLLNNANDDVDDKLRKLRRAGTTTIDLAVQLEETQKKLQEKEKEPKKSGTNGDLAAERYGIARELKEVKGQLVAEKAELLRELAGIKQHCHQITSQLDFSRSAQAQSLKELEVQTQEMRSLRKQLESSDKLKFRLDNQQRVDLDERNFILQGMAGLQRDLQKVQKDAIEIGEDLQLVKTCDTIQQPFATQTCQKSIYLQAQSLQKQQAKGLLVQIQYLKTAFTRESWFRADLAQQKKYLLMDLEEKQKSIDATHTTLARFGMPLPVARTCETKSLRSVATAVIFLTRASRLSDEWKRQSVVRSAIKEAYRQTRGKDLIC